MSPDAAPPLRERAARMVERVRFEASAVLSPDRAAIVASALADALAVRDVIHDDDHAPPLLHPARTVLILLSDAACHDADTLAAAAFFDSLPGAPVPDPGRLRRHAADILAAVPVPPPDPAEDREDTADGGDTPPDDARDVANVLDFNDALERLREDLVTAPTAAALIALAERLDHARHLHLMPDVPPAPLLAGIQRVYSPVAARLCPRIAQRLDRWARSYTRRVHHTPHRRQDR